MEKKVILYETGTQQRKLLFSFEGCTREEADELIRANGYTHYELVDKEGLAKKRKEIEGYSQWYIIKDRDLVSGKYYTV